MKALVLYIKNFVVYKGTRPIYRNSSRVNRVAYRSGHARMYTAITAMRKPWLHMAAGLFAHSPNLSNTYIVMAYIVMAYPVMALYSYGLCSYGLQYTGMAYSYGLYSDGLHGCGLLSI